MTQPTAYLKLGGGRLLGIPAPVYLFAAVAAIGWVLQAVLLATGIVLPVMYIVALVFVALWIFCFVKGRALDRGNATQPEETA